MKKLIISKDIKKLIRQELKTDIGKADITTLALIPKGKKIRAAIVVKKDGVIAGLDIARAVFTLQNKNIKFKANVKDGSYVKVEKNRPYEKIAFIEGSARDILMAERTALNILSHLSGVATLTRAFVDKVRPYKAKITDTRKTTLLLRDLEKYAVRVAGGYNHRLGLYDQVLIKGNHIKVAGISPARCVKLAKKKTSKIVEVELKKVADFDKTIKASPDIIMLDNMKLSDIKKALKKKEKYASLNKGKKLPKIEVSGNICLDNVRKVAALGVDFISVGALTHSNPSLDMALKSE